jgi:fermentation-respiration switch protein FrsA (DUF1100 family)
VTYDFGGGEPEYTSGTVHEITPEGATPQTTTHPTLTSNARFLNYFPLEDIETISPRPVMFVAGDQAHSLEFAEDAYRRAAEPKELVLVRVSGPTGRGTWAPKQTSSARRWQSDAPRQPVQGQV